MGQGMSDGAREPVVVENPDGLGPVVIVCDHASNRIPAEYAAFGFAEDALQTHIAWDPGALAVARLLSAELDAPLIWPDVSRLVIDCNRAADVASLIVTESEERLNSLVEACSELKHGCNMFLFATIQKFRDPQSLFATPLQSGTGDYVTLLNEEYLAAVANLHH